MAHKRISSLYFMADSKDDLTHLPESQMGTTCFVIEDACEYKRTSDGRWIPQMASSIATTPGAGGNVDLTGYATEGYVDTKIANLVGSAPENLNTLHEIAVAFKESGDVLDTLNEAIGEKANRSEIPDVSIFQEKGDYALRSEIPDVSNFQEKGDYALQSEIPDLTNYALKEELPEVPSLEGYALKSELPDLTNYALKEEIPEIPSLEEYALKSEIPSIAGLATEKYVTDAIANVEHPLPSTIAPNQHLVTNEKGEMIWEERSHWTEEQEDYLVNTSGSGKYIPCPGLHSLKPNKEYTIIHNGTEYKCISQEMNGTVVLGNLKFAGSSYEDTGEPFFFPGIDKGLVTFYAMFSEGGEHTFSVFGPVDIAKPLSEFYMPQSVPVVKSASKGQAVIVEEVQNGHPTSWAVATIPTKISELDNDVKHATEEYVEERYLQNIETFTQTVEWNGDIEGREVFSDIYYKVSNDTPALEDFAGHYLTFADGTEQTIDGMYQAPLNSYPNDGYNINNMIIVFQNDVEGVASKGIYLEWADHGKIIGVNYTARKTVIPEKLLDSNLVRATAFNELADTVKGLDKYCAFMKQGDQIKLGNVQEYSKMQEEMLNGANKFHATLAITFTNEEGLLISETCYAKSVMSAINMDDGSSPYTKFSFETFDGETIKFQWNADNTISNITIISAEETLE